MLPDDLVAPHRWLHLLVDVHRVIRKVWTWDPNRLIFRTFDCANEKVRNALRYSGSGIDQLDKAKPCKFWDARSEYRSVPDYSIRVLFPQSGCIIDKRASSYDSARRYFDGNSLTTRGRMMTSPSDTSPRLEDWQHGPK